jgi:hypothetical protein
MRPFIRDFKSLLYKDIVRRKKTTPFIVMLSFILSFALARLTSLTFPEFNIIWKQYHIHHFYFGIASLAIAGWIALVSNKPRLHTAASILFGSGLGLVTDEIGLLLTCSSDAFSCNYYARQSYDFAVIIVLLFLNIIYFLPFWLRVKSRAYSLFRHVLFFKK